MKKSTIVRRMHLFPDPELENIPDPDPKDPPAQNNSSEDIEALKAERDKYKKGFLALKDKTKKLKETPSIDNDELKKSSERIANLESMLKKMEEEKEAGELKNKDQKDQDLFNANKKIRELQLEIDKMKADLDEKELHLKDSSSKYSSQMEMLRKENLSSEIAKYADKYSAMRPYQVVDLTSHKFVWDDDLDKWIFPIRNKKGEIIDGKDVEEYIKEFMTAEENDNLVRAGIKGGTGEAPKTGSDGKPAFNTPNTPPANSSGKFKIVITDKIKKEAMMRDLPVEEWVALLQERQEMLANKRGR